MFFRGRIPVLLPSKRHEDWHEEQMWMLKTKRFPQLLRAEATMTVYAMDKRPKDLSNSWESIADLLVDAGILLDDNHFCLHTVHLIFGGIDKVNPRAEVTLT